MSNNKIQKSYIDYGFGFAVQVLNAPLKKIEGDWVLDFNFEKYEKTVLFSLALKPTRLTGNEVKFIRHYLEMDLKVFGKRFGNVAHSAVIKWEKLEDESTNMNWATEKDIRLAIVDRLRPKALRKTYGILEEIVPRKSHRIKIDSLDLKAA
jgi:DNA-binding transcriptional regulator YiaG